tara:strand:- start:1086 stop:1385 length:300 start_codon:yes stop_codon:yes gene_type:complete
MKGNYPYEEFVEAVQSKSLDMNLRIKPLLISSKVVSLSFDNYQEHLDNIFILVDVAEICGYDCNDLDRFVKLVIDLNYDSYEGIKDFNCLHHYIQLGML